jgi:hypothetical protein
MKEDNMPSQLTRVDMVPSNQWSVIDAVGQLVWAHNIDGGLIATYWAADLEPDEGYCLIRTDTLPDQHSVNPGPGQILAPYWPRGAGVEGAYPYINSEVFLWVARVPLVPDYAIEGVTPSVTYPLNRNITPPTE